LTVEQAAALVEWVAASGKNLTTIYVTHGHGDHFFGIGAVLNRFSQRESDGNARCGELHAPAGLAGLRFEFLEGALSRPNPGTSGDRRGTQRKCNPTRRA